MSAPVVSVIVPAYNASATLGRCLATLRSQSLANIEIVVVDDGSTDDTLVMARVAARQDTRIRIAEQSHGGRAAARNTGLATACGRYVGFVDADDEAMPRMFELLLSRACQTSADLVVGQYVGVSARTGRTLYHYAEGDPARYGTDVTSEPELLLQPGASVCNKLFARDLFDRAEVAFPSGLDFEDLAVAYRLTGEAVRVEYVDEVVYRYHHGTDGSIMSACDERYLQIITALELTNAHFRKRGRYEALYPQLLEINFTHLISGRLADLLRFGAPSIRRDYLRAAFAHLDRRFPDWRQHERVRRACGSATKHAVCTSRALLLVYAACLHATRSEGHGA